jgi:hypothetical protein
MNKCVNGIREIMQKSWRDDLRTHFMRKNECMHWYHAMQIWLKKESLNNDGQQIHQYQQDE